MVQKQFQIVGSAKSMLAEKQFPASVETWKSSLEQMKSDLAGAKALSNWPNPAPEETAARIDDVLSAISSRDIGQLKKFADSAATPALLNAVCVNWPAVHAVSPDDDYQIYQDVFKGLGRVPDATAKLLADLWSQRLKQASDAISADKLWTLAKGMSMDKQASGPAVNYINDWIGFLQTRYPQEKKAAINDFLDRTAAFDQWSLSEAQLSAVKSFRDKLTFVPKPGTGPLPSKDFARPIPGGDVIYTPPFDPNFTMRFKLMQKKPQGSYYLCTTEVPVGWFIELVGKERAPTFKRLMDVIRPQLLAGPSAWAHLGDWISVNPGWIAPEDYHNWSDNFHVEPASAVKPMQYVSPLAAMDAARLIGCRLPTVQEWQLAYDEGGRDNDDNTGGPNWQALWATINAIQPAPGPASLTFPSFKAELPPAPAAGAAANVIDVLWYRNVPRDFPTFHDMRGNVAEWVLDSPDVKLQGDNPIKVTDGTSTVEATGQDDAKLNDFYKHCLRIGLTSTSPSNEDEKTARLPDDPSHKHHHQFFDVGFRLALDDTPDDPEKFIAQSIKEMQMLGE
jgi:formylglycine-generating enzyme required for sulfatase activity